MIRSERDIPYGNNKGESIRKVGVLVAISKRDGMVGDVCFASDLSCSVGYSGLGDEGTLNGGGLSNSRSGESGTTRRNKITFSRWLLKVDVSWDCITMGAPTLGLQISISGNCDTPESNNGLLWQRAATTPRISPSSAPIVSPLPSYPTSQRSHAIIPASLGGTMIICRDIVWHPGTRASRTP